MKLGVLVVVAAMAMVVGIGAGAAAIPIADVWRALIDPSSTSGPIVWQLRLPRVVLAFLVGGALGISGAALQAMIRNPLAEPYLLGISGGAGLGAVLAISLGLSGLGVVPAAALVGALVVSGLVYAVATLPGARLEPRVLVLVGVVFAALCGALISALLALSEAAQLRNAFLWLLGGFGNANWAAVAAFALYGIGPAALLFALGRGLDVLSLGDETAHGLGVDTGRARRLVFGATALLTAASVATSGMIGFVGLIVPHGMRGFVGPLHRRLLPAVFVASGGLLVLADVVARTAIRPAELPIGTITALIGVPMFAVLLRRSLR